MSQCKVPAATAKFLPNMLPLLSALVWTVTLLLCGISCSGKSNSSNKLQIAAASSLAGAFDSVGKEFTKQTGIEVNLILSSSGNIAKQIREGAPYDLFASANLKYLNDLQQSKDILPSPTTYAMGRLAMWTKTGSAPTSVSALTDTAYEHIAIANPEHAPYGMAAKEVLLAEGIWSQLEGHLVRGSNVRQAMQFAQSGNAEVAIIALSLALHGGGSFTLIDAKTHAPLLQAIGILRRSKQQKHAQAFIEFLQSAKGRALLEPYGLQAAQ